MSKHESGSAALVALRKTLRNTRRVIGSEINVKIKGEVKGSGRGRPLYTNNGFTRVAAGPALSHVRIIIVMPRTDAS